MKAESFQSLISTNSIIKLNNQKKMKKYSNCSKEHQPGKEEVVKISVLFLTLTGRYKDTSCSHKGIARPVLHEL